MQLSPNVHRLEATRGSYGYLVLGDEPTLIDTGLPGRGERILAELRTHGLRPGDLAHILLTHHDIDHIGNARHLAQATGATVWAPAEDVPFIHGHQKRTGIKRLADLVVRVEGPSVQQTYEPGMRIGELEVIPSPGHTPGHTSLRLGDTLFAGDLIATAHGRLRLLSELLAWDSRILRRSIQEVGRLSFDWILPAHGDPVRRGTLWDSILDA